MVPWRHLEDPLEAVVKEEIPSQKVPKKSKNDALKVPGSSLGSSSDNKCKKRPKTGLDLVWIWSLFGIWCRLLGHLFFDVFWVPSQNDFFTILEPKRPPKWRLLEVNLETFSENVKTSISKTPHTL